MYVYICTHTETEPSKNKGFSFSLINERCKKKWPLYLRGVNKIYKIKLKEERLNHVIVIEYHLHKRNKTLETLLQVQRAIFKLPRSGRE